MQAADILKKKGSKVWCISDSQTVQEAISLLVQQKIGAVLVLNKKKTVSGILSERDIMRACNEDPKGFAKKHAKDYMTRVVIRVKPSEPIENLMNLMTKNRIRHLPVMENDRLEGIVSIGDVVKSLLKETREENKHLIDYMFSQQ